MHAYDKFSPLQSSEAASIMLMCVSGSFVSAAQSLKIAYTVARSRLPLGSPLKRPQCCSAFTTE